MRIPESQYSQLVGRTLTEVETKATRVVIIQQFRKFIQYVIESLIQRLNDLPPSKYYGLNRALQKIHQGPSLRYQLTTALKEQLIQIDDENSDAYIKYIDFGTTKSGKITVQIKLDEELAKRLEWLEYGTGIYNEKEGAAKMPIVPVDKEYMFIPGPMYAKNYYVRKFGKFGVSEMNRKIDQYMKPSKLQQQKWER